MIKTIILTLVIGVVLFELIEHVVFPLFWSIMGRKRKSVCGVFVGAGDSGAFELENFFPHPPTAAKD